MNSNERIIRLEGKRIFISPDFSIQLTESNLANRVHLFSTRPNIFWRVKVTYDTSTFTIFLDVINYKHDNIEQFNSQTVKGKVVRIVFNKLDWNKLEQYLGSYKEDSLREIADNLPIRMQSSKTEVENSNNTTVAEENKKNNITPSPSNINQTNIDREWTESYEARLKYSDATFIEGGVIITKFTTNNNQVIKHEVFIENLEIGPELDYIKYYFYKIFRDKYFNFNGTIQYKNNIVIDVYDNKSDDIQQIKKSILESVRELQINEILDITNDNDKEKKLYTIPEIIDIFKKEDKKARIIFDSETEIIDILLKPSKHSGNRTQLLFLSGKMQSADHRIKFTLNPKFGFLFTIDGENQRYYCWELLVSHANYLWIVDNTISIEEQYYRVEKSINFIIEYGRNKYKKSYKEGHIDSDIIFKAINHTTKKDTDHDRFKNWKDTFLKYLGDDN
ncbi:hypothetical protein [Saccharicrinis aurantiacus]|uniref:hypothetical protein n=1 Tax=Saccharicrinis aurantiacus TaxID=1849719 RepID=UPI002492AFFE|nr:hypothetical protein [Saccharicrinis aurantiacus]